MNRGMFVLRYKDVTIDENTTAHVTNISSLVSNLLHPFED